MNIEKFDLNLLLYLDVLLREQNVTRAASRLRITQPAMSNGLKRLRTLLNDPLLVRTAAGMVPTERALRLQPVVRGVLLTLEETLQPDHAFKPEASRRVFRIMASDYAASTLVPALLKRLTDAAPEVALDIMTPSDVTIHEVESGKVDMALNRFDDLPLSFHQSTLWTDDFFCLVHADSAFVERPDLDSYLAARHVWVSKTGFGVGVGMDTEDVQKLGWVDEALAVLGAKRNISVFTRNYHVAMHLTREPGLVATLPGRAARLYGGDPQLRIIPPPFVIPPFELKMIWSPLLNKDAGHVWLRGLIRETAAAGA
ncbi:MAG: LysR substrate-binding domain-containing protein [Acidihalobacter sp.]